MVVNKRCKNCRDFTALYGPTRELHTRHSGIAGGRLRPSSPQQAVIPIRSPHRVQEFPDVCPNQGGGVTQLPETVEVTHQRPIGIDCLGVGRIRKSLGACKSAPIVRIWAVTWEGSAVANTPTYSRPCLVLTLLRKKGISGLKRLWRKKKRIPTIEALSPGSRPEILLL